MTGAYVARRVEYTTGAVWRSRRNAVMFAAHFLGASERLLADTFDLSASTVHGILETERIPIEGLAASEALAYVRALLKSSATQRKG